LKRSPKLFRPVEVEVLVDPSVGVGKGSSVIGIFRKELKVDDLPRRSSLERVGDDRVDALDPCRTSGPPGTAKIVEDFARALCDGEGIGEANPWFLTSSVEDERKALTAEDSAPSVRTELFADCGAVERDGD